MAQKSRLLLAIGFGLLAFSYLVQDNVLFIAGLAGVSIGMLLQAKSISTVWYAKVADVVLSVVCLVAAVLIFRGNPIQSQIVGSFLVIGFLSQAMSIGVSLVTNRKTGPQ